MQTLQEVKQIGPEELDDEACWWKEVSSGGVSVHLALMLYLRCLSREGFTSPSKMGCKYTRMGTVGTKWLDKQLVLKVNF